MLIYDWTNPDVNNHAACLALHNLLASDAATVGCPTYIRTYGPVGAQPGAIGTPPLAPPPSLPGAISGLEHPQAAQPPIPGAGPTHLLAHRNYAASGVDA